MRNVRPEPPTLSMHLRLVLIAAHLFVAGQKAEAAEGGGSHYLPGLAGDIALALVPEPGAQVSYGLFYENGELDVAVLGGDVNVNISLDFVLHLIGGVYTFETPVAGITYTVGAILPFGYADVDAKLELPGGLLVRDDADAFSLSDLTLIPAQLNWGAGDFSFKFAQVVFAPTGDFDEGRAANLGRNYWSFNTVGAVTWLYEGTGTEISVAPGVMFNTRNTDTNYKTGHEFHVDYVANQFLWEEFAIGLRGYYYRQFTGDSGRGAVLGDFKSEALGLGVGFFWTPAFARGKLSVQGKWMQDVFEDNRFDSDYATFGVAWRF